MPPSLQPPLFYVVQIFTSQQERNVAHPGEGTEAPQQHKYVN